MSAPDSRPASVLVGIATRNRAEEVERAIASALAQTYPAVRIAVVDDASNDGTPSLRERFPQATWVRWDEAGGYVRARNLLMLTAAEDYYASLDDDARFVAGDELSVAVAFLDRAPKVAAVAFDILSPDRPSPAPRGPARPAAMFVGCGHVLRLSAVRRLSGYAEAPDYYGGEEKDLCLRLVDAGYEIVKLDGVHVWHEKSARSRNVEKRHRSGVCNDLAFELRRCPAVFLAPVLAWKISRHVMFAVRHRLLRACLSGIGRFIESSGEAWRSRRAVRLSSYARFIALIRAGRADAAA